MIYYTGRVVHGGWCAENEIIIISYLLGIRAHSFIQSGNQTQSIIRLRTTCPPIYGYLNQCKLLTPCPAIINVHSNARRHCCWTRDHETEPLKEIWSIRLIVLPFSCNKQIKSKQPWQPAAISWKAKSVCGLFVATSYTI